MTRIGVTFLTATLIAGCGFDTDESSRAITGGVEEFGYPAVCALVSPSNLQIFCTCTYIGTFGDTRPPRVVTAAHCVHKSLPSDMKVAFGHEETNWDVVIDAVSAVAHPNYQPSFSSLKPSDIAFVELANAPAGITPIPANPDPLEGRVGELWTHIGFGADHKQYRKPGNKGPYRWAGYGIKRSVKIPTTAISAARGEYDYIVTDLDNDNVGEDTCYGDSGGPATALFGQQERVVGVTSRGASDCLAIDTVSIDTRVDSFIDFLSGPTPANTCGDALGVCDPGETCSSCPSDCARKNGGNPATRFCCGDGVQQSAEGDGAICDGNY